MHLAPQQAARSSGVRDGQAVARPDRAGRTLSSSSAHLGFATLCATLVPIVTAWGASLAGAGGFTRTVVAWVIAALAGLAVYASAAASR